MSNLARNILIAICLSILPIPIFAIANRTPIVDSIPRPEIEKLFAEADLVAFIKIVSGDAENYADTLYKATVNTAYKGTEVGKTIFFGPYISYGVGSEYLIFLKNSGKVVGKIPTKDKGSRTVMYNDSSFRIMYGGYSILPVSFECVFGPITVLDGCSYAVNIETVILPKSLKSYPEETSEARLNGAFVRKDSLETFLTSLKKK